MIDDNVSVIRNGTINDTFDDCNFHVNQNLILFRFLIYSIFLNSIGIIGIFGNSLSMIILSKYLLKSSINYLLIGLARCDVALIITSIILFGIPPIYQYTGLFFSYNYYIYPYLACIFFPIALIAQTSSVYLTLTVTLERFVAVCRPLRAKSLCTYGRARVHFYFIIIMSTLYNLPKFWEIEVETIWSTNFNTTINCLTSSSLRNNPNYEYFYIHWAYFIVMYLLPFSSIAILNLFIYIEVRKANTERQILSRTQRREIGLATMLLCVVLVFFVCNIFPLIVNVLDVIYKINIDSAVPISNLFVVINSSVNFVIYVSFGGQFKKTFLKLMCARLLCCGSQNLSHNHHHHNNHNTRVSPDNLTHEDSIMSVGDKYNFRLNRQSPFLKSNQSTTSIQTNTTSLNSVNRSSISRNGKCKNFNVAVYQPIIEKNSNFSENESSL